MKLLKALAVIACGVIVAAVVAVYLLVELLPH